MIGEAERVERWVLRYWPRIMLGVLVLLLLGVVALLVGIAVVA